MTYMYIVYDGEQYKKHTEPGGVANSIHFYGYNGCNTCTIKGVYMYVEHGIMILDQQ